MFILLGEDDLERYSYNSNKKIQSRPIIGTGKYKKILSETTKAVKASGADMVTVAVRRVNVTDKKTNVD